MKYIKDLYRNFKSSYSFSFANKSYAQEGEDMILNRYLEHKENGYFIDVGAHHPWRFSNTFFFYKKGWNGINIDSMPNSMRLFKKVRPKDINLEVGISQEAKELEYFVFNEPAVNGFSKSAKEDILKLPSYKLLKTLKIRTYRLSDILDQYLPVGKKIDFLTIDAEGMDLEVLKSNDWNKYRPSFVLAESDSSSLEEIKGCSIYQFMQTVGYHLVAKSAKTFIYQLKNN
jgi:FkbM family methyltransferase